MGEVYRAVDTRLQRSVAVKILPPALAADAELRDRFAREARVISSLNHPNICTLFDVGEAPADQRVVHFLVLEPFLFAQPRRLFPVKTAPPGGVSRHYAVSRDGTRLLVAVRLPTPATPWVVTTNAFAAPR
jgi:serine/threonine protein kinase